MIGQVVAGWKISRKIGEGGMGAVYEATQGKSRVAIKVLLPEHTRSPEIAQRFFNEARAVKIINDPGIVQVHEFGQLPSGAAFIVMEFLDGESLGARLKRHGGKLGAASVGIARQVAQTLSAAHAKQIVHRDLKPDNVMIVRDPSSAAGERTKLLDFGIAKLVDATRSDGAQLTGTGEMLGTPTYMAPEQCTMASGVTDKADVYSLGTMLFQMIAGRPPFVAQGLGDLITQQVLNPPPPIQQFEPSVPPAVADLVHRMLAKEPGPRPSAAEVAHLLAQLEPQARAMPTVMAQAPMGQLAPSSTGGRLGGPTAQRTIVSQAGGKLPEVAQSPSSGGGGKVVALALAAVALLGAGGGATWYFGLRKPAGPPPPILRLHGSTTVGGRLAPSLSEAFLEKRGATGVVRKGELAAQSVSGLVAGAEQTAEVQARSSTSGITDLEAGTADIAMSSRPISDDEFTRLAAKGLGDLRSDGAEHVLALDGIAVIVAAQNPVSSLSKQQLADIFSGRAKDWAAVGGTPGPIKLYVRPPDSGTMDVFRSLVLGEGGQAKAFATDNAMPPFPDGAKLSEAVEGDKAAIGVVSLTEVGGAKPLAISDGGDPVAPTKFNVAREDYPLSRRHYLYTAEQPKNPLVKEFIDFALSPEGQALVDKAGFAGLDPRLEPPPRCPNCPADYNAAVRGAQQLSITFRFRKGGARLDSRALVDLKRLVRFLSVEENRAKALLLLGFSEGVPSRDVGRRQSKERAQAVAQELAKAGIANAQVLGLGGEMPVASNATPQGQDRNRRVEVWLR